MTNSTKIPFTTRHPGFIRYLVQTIFFTIVIFIGIKFYLFNATIEAGRIPNFERPPGVEAFLPISALVSLKHTVLTGTINSIHPSGLVIFLVICLTAILAKKSFCAWICPIGFFSEHLNRLNRFIFKKSFRLPNWFDRLLQSLKYIILGFFAWSIFVKMPIESIEQFIQSPYNRFADIKMLKFFTEISNTALTVTIALILLSFLFRFFWCRYLCPYGALLGLLGFLSLGKIKRDASLCTQCGTCEKKCIGQIKIREKQAITSPECTACMECVTHCPEKQAIGFSFFSGKIPVRQMGLAIILAVIFFCGISLAKLSGNWQNNISSSEYQNHILRTQSPMKFSRQISPEKMERMRQMMMQMRQSGKIQPIK